MTQGIRSERLWQNLRYILVTLWVLFTVALTAWWGYFAVEQLEALAKVDPEHSKSLVRYQHMLVWEGGTLFLCLLGGGAALAYLSYRERKESRRIREFFASFTHELKTPIASMRLQAEVLSERLKDEVEGEKVKRLLSDIGRLYIRLENSLFLASELELSLVDSEVKFSDLISSIRDLWPQLEIMQNGDCLLHCDRRALEVVIGNLLQNAVVHGKAERVVIDIRSGHGGLVVLSFRDEGSGYRAARELLGKLYARPYSGSGSGIGLYLIQSLCRKMRGTVRYPVVEKGFRVEIELPGELA